MDKKSKVLLAIFCVAVVASVSITYYRYIIKRDYYIRLQAECDPAVENCFAYECDPALDAECPEDTKERVSYYKYIEKKVYNLSKCSPDVENCPAPTCVGDSFCREFLCDENSLGEGEYCASLE